MKKFIDLSNICEVATETTIQLFNSFRPWITENGVTFKWVAYEAIGCGVMVEQIFKNN